MTTTEGTGLVHNAGAFGEEDKLVTDALGIVPVVPVDARGRFTAPVDDYAGVHVFDANLLIVDHLKARLRMDRSSESARRGRGFDYTRHGAAAVRVVPPLLPALLAMPEPADLHGCLQLVRRGDQDQGADG